MSEFENVLASLDIRARGSLVSLARRACSGQYAVHGDPNKADCIVVPAFGYEKDSSGKILPGVCNAYVAKLSIEKYPKLPKILQFEVDDAYRELDPTRSNYRIKEHRNPGQYLDTREVCAQAVEVMHNNGWQATVLLGHPYHLPRIDSVMQKLGVETVVEEGIEPVWVENSEQRQTTSPEQWAAHEIAALGHYAKNGWLKL